MAYIDPPFNTEGSSYAFIDKFKDSTWLTMMKDRIQLVKEFLTKNGSFYIHLDHNCNFLVSFKSVCIYENRCFLASIVGNVKGQDKRLRRP
ncbi:MAG: hypothetical protein JRJ70_16470 [Deltaproteobacteria bacterium]|nr:hypothetical protein [Deltaproteobacteria bacterium]